MTKSELFAFMMGMADRAQSLIVSDREFDYKLGIDWEKFHHHIIDTLEAARACMD